MQRLSPFAVILIPVLVLSACRQHDTPDTTAPTEKVTIDSVADIDVKFTKPVDVSPRDLTIDSTNSYSTLFLDTTDVSNYLAANTMDENMARRLQGFYNARNFQYAWFSKDGVTEQGRGFWNMYSYYIRNENNRFDRDSLLTQTMQKLVSDTSIKFDVPTPEIKRAELQLTRHFITYALKYYGNRFTDGTELQSFIPAKKADPLVVAQDLVRDTAASSINRAYAGLHQHLRHYLEVAAQGGFPIVSTAPKDTIVGKENAANAVLKKRLFLAGILAADDTSAVYTQELKEAILQYQQNMGYKPTGILSTQQLKDMNVPIEKRIDQIVMNMDRAKWFIQPGKGRVLTVNIPEFVLRATSGDSVQLQMPVVVGKEGSNTTMFTGKLSTIVFSPYWNVPYGITKNEIVPGINRRGRSYLNRQNMEIVGRWADGTPRVRQKPGGSNSLGKVKFLFPNSFDIYFHDSPAKSLFNRDKRAFSHGCIRLSRPKALAKLLLQNDTTWTDKKLDSVMNLSKEHRVNLRWPVAVIISYYTAWVDAAGQLHFADDIYGHDTLLHQKMFEPNVFADNLNAAPGADTISLSRPAQVPTPAAPPEPKDTVVATLPKDTSKQESAADSAGQ